MFRERLSKTKGPKMTILSYAAAVLLCVGILVGVRAATLTVRNSQDDFIDDLHRQGRWAASAATLAGVGGLLEQALKLL
jgi:hypothetical protein